jgi:hypothetical protein
LAERRDKATAGVPCRGEAGRILVRRPRLDRDGLFLFGRRHDSQTLTISATELQGLANGKWLAVDVLGEYLLYIHIGPAGDE